MTAAGDLLPTEFDIVIAGAGLVGAALACALATECNAQSLKILLVEPGVAPTLFADNEFDPRVVALTRQSQSLLESLNVWPFIKAQRACAYRTMSVWDGEGTASIRFDSEELHQPDLGHIVENSTVLVALLQKLDEFPCVELRRGCRVREVRDYVANEKNQRVIILDSGEIINASLLIAADGAESPIRRSVGIHTREWDYGQRAIVATVKCTQSHQHTAWQRFSHTGPLAFLPLETRERDDHYCSIVWSCDESLAKELMLEDDQHFQHRLASTFENCLGDIESISKRFSFPLRQRHASEYIQPGIALIGDAAHTIHPLAGQGVNLGLQDVIALVAEIKRAQQRSIPLWDYSILKRYQRERKAANLTMMALMEGFKQLFGNPHPVLHVARNVGMRGADGLGFLKNTLAKHAMGIG